MTDQPLNIDRLRARRREGEECFLNLTAAAATRSLNVLSGAITEILAPSSFGKTSCALELVMRWQKEQALERRRKVLWFDFSDKLTKELLRPLVSRLDEEHFYLIKNLTSFSEVHKVLSNDLRLFHSEPPSSLPQKKPSFIIVLDKVSELPNLASDDLFASLVNLRRSLVQAFDDNSVRLEGVILCSLPQEASWSHLVDTRIEIAVEGLSDDLDLTSMLKRTVLVTKARCAPEGEMTEAVQVALAGWRGVNPQKSFFACPQ